MAAAAGNSPNNIVVMAIQPEAIMSGAAIKDKRSRNTDAGGRGCTVSVDRCGEFRGQA